MPGWARFSYHSPARSASIFFVGLPEARSSKIIDEHGGKTYVQSEYQKSSRFSFMLPARMPSRTTSSELARGSFPPV